MNILKLTVQFALLHRSNVVPLHKYCLVVKMICVGVARFSLMLLFALFQCVWERKPWVYDDKCGRRSQFFMLEFWLVKRQTWTFFGRRGSHWCLSPLARPTPYNLTNFKWSASIFRELKVKLVSRAQQQGYIFLFKIKTIPPWPKNLKTLPQETF